MLQKTFQLPRKSRGFHLITHELLQHLPELSAIESGIAHFFIQHSSASLTINENSDPDVRADMERFLMHVVPENAPYFEHVLEGADDMPAHIKASLFGAFVSVPVSAGQLMLGTWQGIWLGEHRQAAGPRSIVATIIY